MCTLNVLIIFLVLSAAVTFGGATYNVNPPSTLTCNLKACQRRCLASGATGFCQVERNGSRRCMCMFSPPPLCDPNTCRSDCIANGNGATGGICQTERDGTLQCICSFNPLPPLCDPNTCRSDCIANGNGATGGICQTERDGSLLCMCMF